MHAFDRQTDGQTDRRTDGQTEISSLDRVCIACSAVKTESESDKFKSLGIDKCSYDYQIPRTDWTDDSVIRQNGVDNVTIESYSQMTSLSSYVGFISDSPSLF